MRTYTHTYIERERKREYQYNRYTESGNDPQPQVLPLLLVRFARLIIAFTVSGSAWAREVYDEDIPCITFWLQAATTFLKAFNSSSVMLSILATRSSHSSCYIDMRMQLAVADPATHPPLQCSPCSAGALTPGAQTFDAAQYPTKKPHPASRPKSSRGTVALRPAFSQLQLPCRAPVH